MNDLRVPTAEVRGKGVVTNPLPGESPASVKYRHALRKACAIGYDAAKDGATLDAALEQIVRP